MPAEPRRPGRRAATDRERDGNRSRSPQRRNLQPPRAPRAPPAAFVFGSELHALDLRRLARYLLFDAVPASHSILDGIAKLTPAHTLVVSPEAKPNVTPYWRLSFSPEHRVSEAQWRDRLIDQLEGSVHSRLGSDGPVGVFVSGGIDCGTVTAFSGASREHRPRSLSRSGPRHDAAPFQGK